MNYEIVTAREPEVNYHQFVITFELYITVVPPMKTRKDSQGLRVVPSHFQIQYFSALQCLQRDNCGFLRRNISWIKSRLKRSTTG